MTPPSYHLPFLNEYGESRASQQWHKQAIKLLSVILPAKRNSLLPNRDSPPPSSNRPCPAAQVSGNHKAKSFFCTAPHGYVAQTRHFETKIMDYIRHLQLRDKDTKWDGELRESVEKALDSIELYDQSVKWYVKYTSPPPIKN